MKFRQKNSFLIKSTVGIHWDSVKCRAERQFKEYLVSNGMLDRWNNKPLQTEDTARRHILSLAWARRGSGLRWRPVRMMVPFRDAENWVWEHTCGEICHPISIVLSMSAENAELKKHTWGTSAHWQWTAPLRIPLRKEKRKEGRAEIELQHLHCHCWFLCEEQCTLDCCF